MDTIFSKAKEYWSRLRETHGNIRSLQFVKFVITTSFVPIFIYLIVWLYAIYAMHIGLNVNILVSLLTELRLFVSVIFSTQTVTGLLAYGVALIDSDGDGESDELDSKAHIRQQTNVPVINDEKGDTK
jgi:hypothetical protein|nr:MAG TPA: hypothetical protein [Caudoviricetes sp.]